MFKKGDELTGFMEPFWNNVEIKLQSIVKYNYKSITICEVRHELYI